MAYAIARSTAAWKNLLLMLIILPFWTSFLLRVYAWIGLLKSNGVINNVLLGIGVIHEPLTLMQTDFAVYVGIVYSYLPFMILPLYANLESTMRRCSRRRRIWARDPGAVSARHSSPVATRNHGRVPSRYSYRLSANT